VAKQRSAGKAPVRSRSGPPLLGIVSALLVFLVIVVLFGVKLATSSSAVSSDNQPVPPPVLTEIEQISAATFDTVGKGTATIKPIVLPGPPLQNGGKPEVLYVGAEYCPYCAAQRWSMLAGLSRFGQFSGLQLMTSAANDIYPSTPTFTFVHASYTSAYLAFASVELETNQAVNGNYQKLQTMTPAQAQIFQKFDAPPYVAQSAVGTIPFLDVASHYLLNGSPFSPQLLHGETWQHIAHALQQPASAEAQAILGGANVLTATICAADNNQPAAVCTSAAVQQVQLAGA
jgi:thiol-disulfide isomerase/thioredoxin